MSVSEMLDALAKEAREQHPSESLLYFANLDYMLWDIGQMLNVEWRPKEEVQ